MISRLLTPRAGIGAISFKWTSYRAEGSNSSSSPPSPDQKDTARRNPFRTTLEAGKTYHWCHCGFSKKVPFCDGSHKDPTLTTKRPVKFVVEQTKLYALCNCQKSKKMPFCDGSHKHKDIPQHQETTTTTTEVKN